MADPLRKLRPQKIRSALARRWFERTLGRLPVSGAGSPLELGGAYGGYIVPAALIAPGWLCYSVGAGGDVTFDLELIERFDLRVRSFEAVHELYVEAARQGASEPRFSAYEAAIALADGPLRMQRSHDPASRSVSSAALYDEQNFLELPGRSLPSLMSEFGDQSVQLLKLDIEGGEYELLESLDLRSLGVQVFLVQLHHNRSPRAAKQLIEKLAAEGYEAVAQRPAVKITFARRELIAQA